MCNPFSGHISFDTEDFGKIYFLSKLHHEEDRKLIPHENIIAWETQNKFDYSSFKFVHSCGKNIDEKTKQALMELLISWGKTRNALDDFKSICVFKKQDGSEIKDLAIDLKHKTISTIESNCIISVMFNGFSFNTSSNCIFNTGSDCIFNTGYHCTFTTGFDCAVIRRDIFQVIKLREGKTIKLNGYNVKGYQTIRKGKK